VLWPYWSQIGRNLLSWRKRSLPFVENGSCARHSRECITICLIRNSWPVIFSHMKAKKSTVPMRSLIAHQSWQIEVVIYFHSPRYEHSIDRLGSGLMGREHDGGEVVRRTVSRSLWWLSGPSSQKGSEQEWIIVEKTGTLSWAVLRRRKSQGLKSRGFRSPMVFVETDCQLPTKS